MAKFGMAIVRNEKGSWREIKKAAGISIIERQKRKYQRERLERSSLMAAAKISYRKT